MKKQSAWIAFLLLMSTGCGAVSGEKRSAGEERFRQIQPGKKQVDAIARIGASDKFLSDGHGRWLLKNSKTGDVMALDVWSDSDGVIRRVSLVPRVANVKGRPLIDPDPALPDNLDTNRSSYTPLR